MKTIKVSTSGKYDSVLISSLTSSFIHKAYFYYTDGSVEEKLEGFIIDKRLLLDIRNVTKVEIFYEGQDLSSEEVKNAANSYYSCTFQKTITTGSFYPVFKIENSNSVNISAAIAITIKDKTVSYNIPVSGKLIATTNRSSFISSDNNILELSDFSGRRFFCAEYDGFHYKDEDVEVLEGVIKVSKPQELTLTVEVRVFSTDGQIKERPIIKGVGIKEWII